MNIRSQWGRAVREQRELLGMSQQALAEAVGVTQKAVSAWETGVAAPSLNNRLAIAKALHVGVNVLFPYPVEVA